MPSKTTLLGLLKHVTYVEGVWFDQAHKRSVAYAEIGIPSTPDRSFTLNDGDTIASVQDAHRSRCAASRRTMPGSTSTPSSAVAGTHGVGTPVAGAP